RYLAGHSRLPVPVVLHVEERLLLMQHVDGQPTERHGTIPDAAQHHVAELLAELHCVTAPGFGHERSTMTGWVVLPNPWTERWVDFFRAPRLLSMAKAAAAARRLAPALLARIDRLAMRLPEWIGEPSAPALIHGSPRRGNILFRGDRVAAFIDPS